MVGCCISNCSYKSGIENKNDVKLFRFPVDQKSQELWMKALESPNIEYNSRMRICSQHFKSEDIICGLRLKKDAIPIILSNSVNQIVDNNSKVLKKIEKPIKKKMKREELEAIIAITMLL